MSMQVPLVEKSLCQGRYQLQRLIGSGGFGRLYLAYDLVLHQACAIKEMLIHDANEAQQVRLEAEALIQCTHPNIVRGYWYIEEHSRHYLVMDYLPGRDLDEELEHRQRSHK